MKSAIISATIIGLFVALSQAVAIPAEVVEARQSEEALLFFVGATPDSNYTLSVAVGGPSVAVDNPLSVSQISLTASSSSVTCAVRGVDNSETIVSGGGDVVVAPPQAQVSVSCIEFE